MRRFLMMALAAALIMVGGCIDYQETLKINEDGSGTLKIRYALDKQYLKDMEQMAEGMGGEPSEEPEETEDDMWTREQIEEALKMEDSDVELIGYEVSEDEQWKIWVMEFSFESLADFEMLSRSLNEDLDQGDDQGDIQRSYALQDDGTWLYTHDFGNEGSGSGGFDMSEMDYGDSTAEDMPSAEELEEAMKEMQAAMEDYSDEEYSDEETEGGDADTDAEDQSEEMEKAMQGLTAGLESMFAGMEKARVKVSVEFPGKIIESNATSVEGNTATWEYQGKTVMGEGVPLLTAKIQP